MDAVAEKKPITFNRWLPYWAVFQSDVRQTLRSWVYRFWVLLSVLATVGYLLYRFGSYNEVGIVQSASLHVSQLLRWVVLGSAVIICVLTAGSISSERGTMADSVLSRGISRYQYFMGKWHARLITVLGTFLVLGLVTLVSALFLLHEDLSWDGSLAALLTVAALLAAVITFGVTVSAITNSTVLGIAVLWTILCGGGFLLSLLPHRYTTPDRALQRLPFILQGHYDFNSLSQFVGWSLLASCLTALVGLVYFSRRDV
ncbi:MAG TPA: ABC transporter permease [Gemmataceae bacterium]|jgi:ABC-type transport system involved in multi-copper enzyme maturation permease subunit